MKLPSKVQCFALWDKYKMPDNIRQHSRQVAKVARKVAVHIKNQGFDVNLKLVNKGALLHDIAKIIAIKQKADSLKKVRHTKIGANIVLQEGLDKQIADIVDKHCMQEFSYCKTLEEQIVNYADKRVKHKGIVTLDQRFADLKARYPGSIEAQDNAADGFKDFEEKYNIDF